MHRRPFCEAKYTFRTVPCADCPRTTSTRDGDVDLPIRCCDCVFLTFTSVQLDACLDCRHLPSSSSTAAGNQSRLALSLRAKQQTPARCDTQQTSVGHLLATSTRTYKYSIHDRTLITYLYPVLVLVRVEVGTAYGVRYSNRNWNLPALRTYLYKSGTLMVISRNRC